MSEYLTIGSAPSDVTPAQVGAGDYPERSKAETTAFKNQLWRVFGPEPEGARLTVKSFPHDFGSYREVVVVLDEDAPKAAVDYAYEMEANTPSEWDEQALEELVAKGFDPRPPEVAAKAKLAAKYKDVDWKQFVKDTLPDGEVNRVYEEYEKGGYLSYGDLQDIPKGSPYQPDDVFVPSGLSGSDYGGSLVEKSNYTVFYKEFGDEVLDLSGGYRSYGVAIPLAVLYESKAMQETLGGLEDYPLISEEEHSELEMEAQGEAWENWAQKEFSDGLEAEVASKIEDILSEVDPDQKLEVDPVELAEAAVESMSGDLYELFRDASDKANEYWVNESGGMYINMARVIERGLDDKVVDKIAVNAVRELDIDLTGKIKFPTDPRQTKFKV